MANDCVNIINGLDNAKKLDIPMNWSRPLVAVKVVKGMSKLLGND